MSMYTFIIRQTDYTSLHLISLYSRSRDIHVIILRVRLDFRKKCGLKVDFIFYIFCLENMFLKAFEKKIAVAKKSYNCYYYETCRKRIFYLILIELKGTGKKNLTFETEKNSIKR